LIHRKSEFIRIDSLILLCYLGTHAKKPVDKKKKGAEVTDPNAQAPTIEAQPLTSPLSVKFKIHKNPSSNSNGETSETPKEMDDGQYIDDDQEELMTYVLTEDIFVEILAARLQVENANFPIRSPICFFSLES